MWSLTIGIAIKTSSEIKTISYTDLWISLLISKQAYPCKDIQQLISVEHEYPRMDIHVFTDISLQLSMLLLIQRIQTSLTCIFGRFFDELAFETELLVLRNASVLLLHLTNLDLVTVFYQL